MEDLNSAFKTLYEEARDLYLPSRIRELNHAPSPVEFLREHVMPNIPLIIRGGVQHWPALTKWTEKYLTQCLGDKTVTVAMTPNGYADAPVGERFVLPHEEQMTMSDFLRLLNKQQEAGSRDVVYVQKQNSSFTDEFSELMPDAAEEISWASEAFGNRPDAINFWMGGNRSITSTHKDPYENLYAVVRGSKTFTLFPPVCVAFMPYEMFTLAQYKRVKPGEYEIFDVLEDTVDATHGGIEASSSDDLNGAHAGRTDVVDEASGVSDDEMNTVISNKCTCGLPQNGESSEINELMKNSQDSKKTDFSLSATTNDSPSEENINDQKSLRHASIATNGVNVTPRDSRDFEKPENIQHQNEKAESASLCDDFEDSESEDDSVAKEMASKLLEELFAKNVGGNELTKENVENFLCERLLFGDVLSQPTASAKGSSVNSSALSGRTKETEKDSKGNNLKTATPYSQKGEKGKNNMGQKCQKCQQRLQQQQKTQQIPWIACNPLKKDPKYKTFFDNAQPIVATLGPGDLLYLPSLWFHHVQQENCTVAVNFWHDMAYDGKYVHYKFLERLSQPHLASQNSS